MGTALKFGGRLLLADAFGRLIAERGFNQAHEIARRCAAACGRKARPDLLLRTRHTAAQMQLSLADCQRNVRGAFVARGDLAGACIAVVDDVMTSGATLDEVAAVLKRAGARHVANLIVARTP